MKIKLKGCNCFGCKRERRENRKKDRAITRFLNRSIRQVNKNICKSMGEEPFRARVSDIYL